MTVSGVGINPLRAGLFTTLAEMGADLRIENRRIEGGEQVGDVTARHGALRGIEVPPERAPSMIDEYPILAVAAACAGGVTRMRGLGELRVKESDRLAAAAAMLVANGVRAEIEQDDLIVYGTGRPPAGGAQVATHMDHRMAMSTLVLGLATEAPVGVDETGFIETSFPGFIPLMREPRRGIRAVTGRIVIAIDGPAASGKGTLARRLAEALGLPHLDTGLLDRAVGRRVLDARGNPADPGAAETAARTLAASDLSRSDLRGPEADAAASSVAAMPEVRTVLLDFQRRFAAGHGAVLDGRDIGTVIFPDSPVKLFVTASLPARARRRWLELQARGIEEELARVEQEMRIRDAQDAARVAAPLRAAADAVRIDTTDIDPDAVFAAALAVVRARLGGG